ncbi:MAG: DUF6326 family protein [Paracoccaceae bacterium]
MNETQTHSKFDTRSLLSGLWLFVLLNIIFRDLHEFATATTIVEITEELLLIGFVLVEIPIAMVLLSPILKYKINRWANIIAAVLTLAVTASALPGDLDDNAFALIEIAALLVIIWKAWKWTNPAA